jgi:hypothetical protein
MTDADAIENEARKAIGQYLASVTYPVIYSNGDEIITLGTAVPFSALRPAFPAYGKALV